MKKMNHFLFEALKVFLKVVHSNTKYCQLTLPNEREGNIKVNCRSSKEVGSLCTVDYDEHCTKSILTALHPNNTYPKY